MPEPAFKQIKNTDTLQSIVDLRLARYDTLFRGELPYEPLPGDVEIGISGLCRITNNRGVRKLDLNKHLNNLPTIIDEILLEHDLAAMDGNEAIFAFIDDDTRAKVGSIVSGIFTQWEVTHNRQGLDILLPNKDSQAKWLVVETATAVMQVVGDVANLNIKTNKECQNISKIIYNWGPRFAKQWFDGTIIKQWMDSENIAEQEQTEWLNIFTPNVRKHLAVYYISDPLKALSQVKENLEVHLTDQSIAKHLNWTESEAQVVFTPSLRKHLAVKNISDPLKALSQVKENLKVHLTDQSIAKHLNWTESEAQVVFTPSLRKYLAVNNISDPLKGCHDWVDGKISLGSSHNNAKDAKLVRLSKAS